MSSSSSSSKSKAKKRKRGGAGEGKESAGDGASTSTSMLFSPSFLLSQGAYPSRPTAASSAAASDSSSSIAGVKKARSSSSSILLLPPERGKQDQQTHPCPPAPATATSTTTASTASSVASSPATSTPLMSFIILPDTDTDTDKKGHIPTALVSCPQTCTLYLSGACHVTLLQGQVLINGHKLSLGSRTQVLCPSWSPAQHMAITPASTPSLGRSSYSPTPPAGSDKKQSKKARQAALQWLDLFSHKYKHMRKFVPALTAVQQDREDPLFATSTPTCWMLIEAMDIDNCNDWMLKAEDFSKYKMSYNVGDTTCTSRLHLSSLLLGDAEAMTQCCIERCVLPLDWVEAADRVCRDIKSCPRVLVCGAKGVGKSTCLRYTLNRLLSAKGNSKCVALLDCDLGQSEFNVSGLVSLHIISAPLLSPSHLRLRTPELSFFIGDTTVKTDPGLFEAALSLLYERYLALRDLYAATGHVAGLSAYVPSDREGGGGGEEDSSRTGFSALDDSPFSKFSLPLVVNTDGWIKSMGLEVLTAIIATTQPTHVIHLCTDKNKDLPALYQLGALPSGVQKKDSASAGDSSNSSSSSSSSSNNSNSSSSSSSGGGGNGEPTAKIFTLKPVRNSASKIAAVDLRNLRLVAYFLRDSDFLCRQQYPPLSQADAMKAPRFSSGSHVLIRNGSLVDPLGLLALALRESRHELQLPFQCSLLRVIGPVLAPRLVLAAMNLSLVGLTKGKSKEERGREGQGRERTPALIRIPAYVVKQLGGQVNREQEMEGEEGGHSNDITFPLDCEGSSCILAPCRGVGIVSDVDLLQQCLHIITPVPLSPTSSHFSFPPSPPSSSSIVDEEVDNCSTDNHFKLQDQDSDQSSVCVVRGSMQIPTTLLYCISDTGVHTPYLSSESCGEGSGKATGARTNLKRRGQQ